MENFPLNISVNSPSLRSFLAALIRSLREHISLVELLDNLSGRNVRRALDFVNTFIGSGHVDSRKIIDKEEEGGYIIPDHEFLRAVIYGDHEHYDPATSEICNLFDVSLPDGREHFLLTILLSFIERSVDSGEGFVTASKVFSFAQDLSFSSSQVYAALERAARKGLLETAPKYSTAERWEAFRITPVGAYTMKRLLGSFAYVDAMIVDTPIMDRGIRESIRNAITIQERLKRFDIFTAYLEGQALKVNWTSAGFDWQSSAGALKADAEKTRRKANASRRG